MRFIIIFLLIGGLVHSQNCEQELHGRVVDFHDGSPLSGAVIIVGGVEKYAQTDVDGYFTIDNLCDETYNLQISHPECSTVSKTVTVPYVGTYIIQMEHHLETLDQVTVKGSAAIDYVSSQLESRLEKDALDDLSHTSLGDALKLLSGVSSLNSGNTVVKPVIQGLHSSRILIMNNGVRMQDQDWGVEHAPNLDLNSAGSIALIKGASALQYGGDAVGGIVMVEPDRVIRKDSLYGSTILTGASNGRGGTLSSSLSKTTAVGWYGHVQGTLKRFGDFEAPNYVLSNTGQFEKAFSVRFGLNKFKYGFEAYYSVFDSETGILKASHLGNAEDLFFAIQSEEPSVIEDFTYSIENPKQEVTHHLAKAKGFMRISNFGKLEAQYDFQFNNRFEYDVRRGGRGDQASVDLELTTHTFSTDLSYDAHTDVKGNVGVMVRYQSNFANPDTGVRRLIPDYDKYDVGVYALGNYTLNDNWKLEAGVRYDYNHLDAKKFYRTSLWENRGYDVEFADFFVEDFGTQVLTNPVFDFHNFSGTLGFTHTLSEQFEIFTNYSLATRGPNPSELFSEGLHHSAARIEIGDLRFQQEVAHKVAVSLHKKAGRFQFNFSPFLNKINDFLLIEPTGVEQTIRGGYQVWEFRQKDAYLLGFDIDANYQISRHFDMFSKFALVKGYENKDKNPLILMPPANLSTTLEYKNEELNHLKLALESNLVFRQNEYPDTNPEIYLPISQTAEIIDVSTPPEAYHLMHFRVDTRFDLSRKSTLAMGLSIYNLFNTEYRDYLNRLRYFADNLGRNIVLRVKINY